MTAADNLRGILLMLASMALFAMEDMFLKWATVDLPLGQVIFVSGFFGALIFALLARAEGQRILTRDGFHPAVTLRNLGETVGSLGYIIALASVPLSTVSALLQAMPLAVTLAAALFMQEQVGWRRWTAICVGFLGVLLVIRPGMEGFRPQSLWVLLTVAGLTLRDLASRRIPPHLTNHQVSAWGLMAITVLGLGMMVLMAPPIMPDPWQTVVLFGALVFGTGGYWAITAATRVGEVSVVSPFRYSRLIFAILIGTFVFAEIPDRYTLVGAGLIIGSGLYAFARERARRQGLLPTDLA